GRFRHWKAGRADNRIGARSLLGLQLFDFVNEVRGFLKPAVDAGETHVGDLVNVAQAVHDHRADELGGHFALEFAGHRGDDVIHQIFHGLRTDGTFLTGLFDAGQKFFARKFLMPPIALEHHQPFTFDFLVSGEAMAAFGAFPAAADGGSLARGARVNDFIFLTAALGATHKTTSNSGYTFVTYQILWCQGGVVGY